MRYELIQDGTVQVDDSIFNHWDYEQGYEQWEIQGCIRGVDDEFVGRNIKEENLIVKRPLYNVNKFLVKDSLHFNDVDIVIALRSLASQELNDGDEYDLMMVAAGYIESLRLEFNTND